MSGYKTEVTLNEKDSLTDMLNLEKSLVKLYATAITEGCSDGFRKTIKEVLNDTINDQIDVFFQLTDKGYARVTSAKEEQLEEQKSKFSPVRSQLC